MKLKILHLFNNYLHQTENWIYNLIKNIPEVEIHIGAHHYLKNNFYHPDFHFIDSHYYEFQKLDRHLSKKNPFELLQKFILKAIPTLYGRTEHQFSNYVINKEIDLIHAHFANVGWHFLEVAQKTRVPFVISFYGWDYEKLPYTQPEYVRRFNVLFQKAQGFICEGEHGASILIKMGCPKEKIHISYLGVEVDVIPYHKRHKEPKKLKLVQVASFTNKKGHIFTVKAFAKILKSCPDLNLTLVGNNRDHEVKKQVEAFIKAQELTQKIKILDFVDHGQLYNFLKDFHVFIHPSCYTEDRDCEGGAPIVLIDAQATGMPVISTAHCDIPEEVVHKSTGLLSPEKNVNDLADNITAFYEMDNKTYQRFARNARLHIEQKFDISKNALLLKSLYENLVNKKSN